MEKSEFRVLDHLDIEEVELDALAKGNAYLGFDERNRNLGVAGLEHWYMKHGLMGTKVFAEDGFSIREMIDELVSPIDKGPQTEKNRWKQTAWEQSDLPLLELRFSFRNVMGDVRENSHCTHYHVEVWYGKDIPSYYGAKTNEENRKIGEVELSLFCWERAQRMDSIWYVAGFGNHDDVAETFFADIEKGILKPEWKTEFSDCKNTNILRIDHIRLDAEFRGRDIGHYILKQVIETFDSQCGIVYLTPWPHYEKDGVDSSQEAFDTAKLVRYFEKMGFSTMYEAKSQYFYPPLMYINLYHKNPRLSHVDTYVYLDY